MRDSAYISRTLVELSNHHSGATAELLEGSASEIDLLLDEKAELRAEVERLKVDCECHRIQAVDCGSSYQKATTEVKRLTAINNAMIPALDRLEKHLGDGCKIEHQGGEWWLFGGNGEGIASGKTIRKMLADLVMSDSSKDTDGVQS